MINLNKYVNIFKYLTFIKLINNTINQANNL